MTKEERALRAQDNRDLTQGPIFKKIILFAAAFIGIKKLKFQLHLYGHLAGRQHRPEPVQGRAGP